MRSPRLRICIAISWKLWKIREHVTRVTDWTKPAWVMKETIAPRYVRQKEAAAHMSLNYHTFRHAVRKGLTPFYALGGNKLFKVEELDAALQTFCVSSTAKVLS
jgi:hypothetical protein